MAEKLIKLRILRPTVVEGKPVGAGEIVEVSYETAVALKRMSELYTGKVSPDAIESNDPEPETRDPKHGKRK